jgi:hypothetical protein
MHVDQQRLCNARLDLEDKILERKNGHVRYTGEGKSSFLSMHMITDEKKIVALYCNKVL